MANFEFIEHMGGMDIKIFCVTIQKRQTHFHGDVEILTPIEGSVSIDLGSHQTLVRTGEFFVVNRNEAHSLSCTDGANLLLVLQFNPGFCKDYYPILSKISICTRLIERARMPRLHEALRDCLTHMIRAVGSKENGYQLSLIGSLNMLAYALVHYGDYEDMTDKAAAGEDRMRIRLANIVEYIQKNYTTNLSLAELSRSEGLDMAYLSHYIKQNLGVSFREYVNRLRLERAVDLVLNTGMRFIDICIECGYSDYRYLNKAFQKEFGMTPAQMRSRDTGARPTLAAAFPDSDAEHSYTNFASVYNSICERIGMTETEGC